MVYRRSTPARSGRNDAALSYLSHGTRWVCFNVHAVEHAVRHLAFLPFFFPLSNCLLSKKILGKCLCAFDPTSAFSPQLHYMGTKGKMSINTTPPIEYARVGGGFSLPKL